MRVLILGSSGMLGHMVLNRLKASNHDVIHIARNGYNNAFQLDLTDFSKFKMFLRENQFDYIINCSGILNDNAERNPDSAILINSYIPKLLEKLYASSSTRIIHISTDCVFNGLKGPYNINCKPDANSIYGQTKALGEIINDKDLTLRTSIIGPELNENGIGLLNWFMKNHGEIKGYSNVYWSGLTTLELSNLIEKAMSDPLTGLVHAVNDNAISKYDLLLIMNNIFFENHRNIIKSDEPKSNKVLVNTKSLNGYKVPTYEKMVQELHQWMLLNQSLYKHYELKG